MKKIATCLLATALCLAMASAAFASNPVRISQVYGGGGGSTGTYLNDYVELFNNSGAAVNIGGWSIQYGSATGTSFGSTSGNMALIPVNTTIAPCGYYLMQVGTTGTAGVALPVTPNQVTSGPNMSATTGKVALINNSTGNNPCTGNTLGGIFVDVVGYGGGNCYETTVAVGTTSTQTLVRKSGGIQDTDVNLNDFDLLSSSGVTIHNAASAGNAACLLTPAHSTTWGTLKVLYR